MVLLFWYNKGSCFPLSWQSLTKLSVTVSITTSHRSSMSYRDITNILWHFAVWTKGCESWAKEEEVKRRGQSGSLLLLILSPEGSSLLSIDPNMFVSSSTCTPSVHRYITAVSASDTKNQFAPQMHWGAAEWCILLTALGKNGLMQHYKDIISHDPCRAAQSWRLYY